MSDESHTITERVRALFEHEPTGDGRVRSHLSVTGPPPAMRAFLQESRIDGGARMLMLGEERMPIRWERHSMRSEAGAWLRVEPGHPPERHEEHAEEARAEFTVASEETLDDEVARASARHPQLAFRYAGLRHRALREDVARGGLWRGGIRVAAAEEPALGHGREGEQMTVLVQQVEALQAPAAAA